MLIKDHVTGGDHSIGGEVKATIPFMVIRKAKKNTFCRAWCKFMGHSGGKIGVTTTPKDTEVSVGGWCTKKSLVWGAVLKSFGGVKVK